MPPLPALRAALTEAFRLLDAAFPGHRVRSADAFTLYLEALEGCDPGALPHAVRAIVRDAKFFPKAAELRSAVRAVMSRYTHDGPLVPRAEVESWRGGADDPCPVCGTLPRAYTVPCPSRVCGWAVPHTHWLYDAPDCPCLPGPRLVAMRHPNSPVLDTEALKAVKTVAAGVAELTAPYQPLPPERSDAPA